MIRISPVRLIGADNEQVGVVETSEAMKMAQEAGLDLVEIVADSRPPVCKIMDYGKFKYEQSKKQKKGAGAGKAAEMKEIRLGRSVKIDPHDIGIRIDQARRFLMAGHKVLVTQRFRGREMAHKELGLDHLRQVADELADIGKVEQYEVGAMIDFSDEGRLVGHINSGDYRVTAAMRAIDGFPAETERVLRHLILSHQGSLEHGSPVVPQMPEAFVLHYADEIDSKMGALRHVADKTGDADWSEWVKLIGRYIYFGHNRTGREDRSG